MVQGNHTVMRMGVACSCCEGLVLGIARGLRHMGCSNNRFAKLSRVKLTRTHSSLVTTQQVPPATVPDVVHCCMLLVTCVLSVAQQLSLC